MTDQSTRDERPNDPLRSPVRPTPPQIATGSAAPVPPPAPQTESPARDPVTALNSIRAKMEAVSDEFAQGTINSVQFNAMYRRYSEQRTIIEKLIERDPESDAWRRVMSVKGQTGFLRTQFEALPLYYAVFQANSSRPLLMGGKQTPIEVLLTVIAEKLWALPNRPNPGLARKTLSTGQWVIVATGSHAGTFVVFSLEPSNAQARLIRDLHADFERANAAAFERNQLIPERMVFPQRALAEGSI
ncbi:MAG: hypothetical protein U0670_21305 [Anaerolineae bacterium]